MENINNQKKKNNQVFNLVKESDSKVDLVHDSYTKKARNLRKGHTLKWTDHEGKKGESTLRMASEFKDGKWVAFPTLYREKNGKWKDYMDGVPIFTININTIKNYTCYMRQIIKLLL